MSATIRLEFQNRKGRTISTENLTATDWYGARKAVWRASQAATHFGLGLCWQIEDSFETDAGEYAATDVQLEKEL